jgi:hypothetical protein
VFTSLYFEYVTSSDVHVLQRFGKFTTKFKIIGIKVGHDIFCGCSYVCVYPNIFGQSLIPVISYKRKFEDVVHLISWT